MINHLPDELLSHIISFLSIDEAVRSSVLSKRWKSLWKFASCLDFDNRQMINPLSQLHNSRSTKVHFDSNQALEYADIYDKLVHKVLHHHFSDLISCGFRHFGLSTSEVEKWVEFVILKKKLSSLSLECELSIQKVTRRLSNMSRYVRIHFKPRIFSNLHSLELTNYTLNNTTSSAFESCENLRILKLKKMHMKDKTINGILENCLCLEKFILIDSYGFKKLKIMNSSMKYLELQELMVSELDVFVENLQVVVLSSLICQPKGLSIFTPNLKSFNYVYDATSQGMQANDPTRRVLKTQDILENCSGLLGSQTINIFRNLSVLTIVLDLNNIRESLSLSFILKSCLYLKNLEIIIPVDTFSSFKDYCSLSFPNSIFWERGILYNCINHKLKYSTIRGFTGREQEVKFVKHLITNGNMIEKMIIICDSLIGDEAKGLLSLPRASPHLSITLHTKLEMQV